MSIQRSVTIIIPRARLEESLHRLSSPLNYPSEFNDQIYDWKLDWDFPRNHNISSLQSYISAIKADKNIMSHIYFFDAGSHERKRINLDYNAVAQGLYQAHLDFALFSVYTDQNCVAEDGAAHLFLPSMRTGFFRFIEALDPIYGWRNSLEDTTGWHEYSKPRDSLEINYPMLIGRELVPLFGLERLRNVEPFAKFELAGPIFVYAHQDMFYDTYDGQYVKPFSQINHPTSWPTPSSYDFDEFLDARSLSWDTLNKELDLPVSTSYPPD